ncbi:MAG: helix-turn-helix transcriptional regulator [Planctomycetaceae bacterium]|nr:helix-turn-helix transcriptional regulator [Planctomycetaceae bacterium]
MASLDDKKFLQRLGERVRKRREERGLTQQQLGDQCDLHRTFIGSVERGERNVSVLNLRRLAVVLRTTPAELFG